MLTKNLMSLGKELMQMWSDRGEKDILLNTLLILKHQYNSDQVLKGDHN